MSGVLWTVSGVVPPALGAEVEADRRPRADHAVMAHRHGARVVDEAAALARPGWSLARFVLGRRIAFVLAIWRASRDADVVVSDAEHTGLLLACGLRLDGLLGRGRPRHVMICHRLTAPKKVRLHRWLRLDRAVDAYVVHASAQRDALVHRLGIDPSKVRLVFYGIDERFWRATPPAQGPATVCAVGLERRDYDTLLEAVDGLDARVVVAAGSPWARRSWVHHGALPPNVEVTRLDPVGLRSLYRRSHVVVVPLEPTDFQAGVTSILEAMATGRPVVHTATDGQTDVVVHGETGLAVPAHDPASLRRAIERLLDDPGLAARAGDAGRCRLEEAFTLDVFTGRVAEIVGELRREREIEQA